MIAYEAVVGAEDFLARLRLATRDLHTRAEARIAAPGIAVDGASYARLLAALLPVYAGVEQRLSEFEEWTTLDPPLDLRRRRRAHLLVADLERLGVHAPGAGSSRRPPPRLERFAHAFGALYVVEGSRLGGRVLARRIARDAPGVDAGAYRFLASDGADVGALWRSLRAALADYAGRGGALAEDALVAGASETFACFDRQLATVGV